MNRENGRSVDSKVFESYPDDHDVIKVTTTGTNAAGTIIEIGRVFIVVANGANSTLPTAGATILTASQNYTMVAGDNVTLLGWDRKYTAIQVFNATFANNSTDFVVNGNGKNYFGLNTYIQSGTFIFGNFQRVSIPSTSTSMVIIAYRN